MLTPSQFVRKAAAAAAAAADGDGGALAEGVHYCGGADHQGADTDTAQVKMGAAL